PVLALFRMASIAVSSWSSLTASSRRIFGRKSTTYSAPRYSSVWPRWRPKPFTSVTVMPCTPISPSASRTSSSLNGFNTAVISFIGGLLVLACTAVEQQPHSAPLSGMQEKGQPGETRFYWEKEEEKRF